MLEVIGSPRSLGKSHNNYDKENYESKSIFRKPVSFTSAFFPKVLSRTWTKIQWKICKATSQHLIGLASVSYRVNGF